MPIFPGALSPSEVLRAHAAGARAVKVFPAGALGGPRYVRDLRGPLGHIPLIAVGGVGPHNAADYLRAGAAALGVGSTLVDPALVRAGDLAALTRRARLLVHAVASAHLPLSQPPAQEHTP